MRWVRFNCTSNLTMSGLIGLNFNLIYNSIVNITNDTNIVSLFKPMYCDLQTELCKVHELLGFFNDDDEFRRFNI